VQSKVMADYIYTLGLKRGVIIEDTNTEYSIDLTKRFKKDFERDGGRIIRVYKIQSNQKDFTPIITYIKRIDPQFIYFTNYYNTIALFLRQLRQMGCKQRVFAGSAASSHALLEIAGGYADGLVFTDDFDPLIPQGNISKEFIKTFYKIYHRLPDSPEAMAADAYFLLIEGLDRFGEDTSKVANFVRNTKFYGVSGKIVIKKGSVSRTVVLREVMKDKFIPIAIYEP